MYRLLGISFVSIIIMMMVAKGLESRIPADSASEPAVAASPKHTASVRQASYGGTEIRRGEGGQFHLTGMVNGEDTRFLVDTGADVVALTVDDAERLGLDADPANFEPIMRTASGLGYGQRVQLERLEVAGHEIANVDAVVMDGLSTNLLGQSALRKLGRVELHGDTLLIGAD
jgi:aspartyl protease family protein